MKIEVLQLGARRHYAVPVALHQAGMLSRLQTDAYVGNKPILADCLTGLTKVTRSRHLASFAARQSKDLPPSKVISHDLLGVKRALHHAVRSSKTPISDHYLWIAKQFAKHVERVGFGEADTVYGLNGASVETFSLAKTLGLRCVLDQTIASGATFRRELLLEEQAWPDWEPNLVVPAPDDILAQRDAQEWAAADIILCGSPFVAKSIGDLGGPEERCRVVSYGYQSTEQNLKAGSDKDALSKRKLRLLFAGGVGLRKGVPYLLEALTKLGAANVETRFAGGIDLASNKLAPYASVATFLGAVPRSEMKAQYEWADALVLPSLCEGSAMVTHEAQSFGLPVICTPNTGALIVENVTGITVPPRDVAAIVNAVEKLPEVIYNFSTFKDKQNSSSNSFLSYRDNLVDALQMKV